jgi:hypothetical protein
MLGHKDAAMTLNVYASLFEDDLDEVSNRLDAALLESAGACMRPNPTKKSSNCPSGPLEEALTRPNASSAPSRIRTYDTGFRNPVRRSMAAA